MKKISMSWNARWTIWFDIEENLFCMKCNIYNISFTYYSTIKDYFAKQVQYKFYPKGIPLDILILIDG